MLKMTSVWSVSCIEHISFGCFFYYDCYSGGSAPYKLRKRKILLTERTKSFDESCLLRSKRACCESLFIRHWHNAILCIDLSYCCWSSLQHVYIKVVCGELRLASEMVAKYLPILHYNSSTPVNHTTVYHPRCTIFGFRNVQSTIHWRWSNEVQP